MDQKLKRRMAGGVAGLVLLAGSGGAYAVTKKSGDDQRQAFLNDVAKRLSVSPQQLESALRGALSDRLAADVKAGRLTQEQADAIKKRLERGGGLPLLGGPGPGHPGPGGFGAGPGPGGPPGGPPPPGPGGPGGPIREGFSAAADYLGLTEAQLMKQIRSGKSLADVAGDRNKPVDGLKSAIEDGVKEQLDKAVADKHITAEQESRILDELKDRIDDVVARKPGDRPPRPDRRHFRRGPHW